MNGNNFAETTEKHSVLEAAHEAFRGFEAAEERAGNASGEIAIEEAQADMAFFATQSALLIGLSIAKDLRRIANTLERRHV